MHRIDTSYRHEATGRTAETGFTTRAFFTHAADGAWYGSNRDSELVLLGASGQPRRIVRWEGPDRSITEAMIAEYREDVEGSVDNLGEDLVRFLLELPLPRYLPVHLELMTDQTRRVWVRDYVRRSAEEPVPDFHYWTVFSADGTRILGRFMQPRLSRVVDAGEDWVLVSQPDAMDVTHVRLYDIVVSEPT